MGIHPFSRKGIALVSCAVLAAGTAALAQMQPGMQQGPDAMPGASNPEMQQPGMHQPGMAPPHATTQDLVDRDFLRSALEGGMAEVQFGQLAAEKAASEDVKRFGQKMVDDHTKLGNDMAQAAQGVGVTPPKGLSKKDKETLSDLRRLSGPQFDDAYIRAMVKNHKRDDADFKMEERMAEIPTVKQVATEGESLIAGHLQMILQIARAHNLQDGK